MQYLPLPVPFQGLAALNYQNISLAWSLSLVYSIHDPTEEEAIHCEYTVSKPCTLVLIYSTLNCTPLTGRSRELT
jgi:hypothetical protein